MRSLIAIAAIAAAAVPCGAQAKPSAVIPATAPTTSVSDLPSAHPAVNAARGQGGSELRWTGSALTVKGNGDSLRSILREMARATGMKVTGGVPDELVFGNYGPGTVQQILTELFDGISVNMMLVDSGAKPQELILTARTGGVTPPSARPLSDDEPARDDRRAFGPQRQFGARGGENNQPAAPPAPEPPPALPPGQEPGNAAATDSSAQPASPNGVRTPEQIFEELRKRQQQQSGAAATQ